ncbi:MAG TPA: zinc ABC transporter substrate-binding protein [Actinomycetota bacterium]|jgi:zinc transport system substrate-binding protein|nr:zinc ABC transporter substrate-binding protein [Actinomycetota bacterium]
MVRSGCAALLSLFLLPVACGGGGGEGAAGADGRPQVVAAFYPLYEVAHRVGGERVDVFNLTPPGVEPHDLELTPRQVDRIEGADMVVFLGAGFQPGVEDVAKRGGGEAIDALEGLTLMPGAGAEEEAGGEHAGNGMDPHVWLDPGLLGRLVERVESGLVRADPAGQATYTRNSAAYRRELGLLDDDFGHRLTGCPRRVLVTAHAAFGYLARRYGLTQEAIAGLSPESEPDPRRLAQLAELVRTTGTTTVFTETLVSPKVAETLAREAGVGTAVLNPIEGLTKEELDAGKSYASVMRDNLDALVKALGCTTGG